MDRILLVRNALQKKVDELNKRGWIQAFERANRDVCLEFENVVDKIDTNYHVSTKLTSKKTYKLLFVLNPSGPSNLDSSRLRETYGKLILDGQARSLRVPLFANVETLFDDKYYFKLVINREKEQLLIRITDKKGKLLEETVYWEFDKLKKMIEKKIKKMVLLEYDVKYIGLDEFFKIKDVVLFEKVNFDKFLNELELGHIRLYMKVGVYTSGMYIGKTHDHGATFQIIDKNLKDLYDTHIIKNS